MHPLADPSERRWRRGLKPAGMILPLLGLAAFVVAFAVEGPHCQTSTGDFHGPNPIVIWFVPALFAAGVVARLLAPKPFRAWTALGIAAVLVVGVIATGVGFVMLDLATCDGGMLD
jgi:drug/metabolite transporter (DMT)-like permease